MQLTNFKFATEMDITIGDINYGGHLGNDKYLSLFQEARLRYLKQFDYSELSIGGGTSLIMSQAHVDFKAEIFWNDRLKIFTRISRLDKIRFTFEYAVVKIDDESKIIASGYTEMAGFDYQNRKLKRLPVEFVQKISELEKFK